MRQLKERTPQTLNISFEEYLKKLGKTEAELYESMAKDNEMRIKNYLIIQEIAKMEKIEVTDAEIEEAIKKDGSVEEGEENSQQIREYYRETLKNEKTLEFLDSLFKRA